ncbi:HNH endonuclease [Pseudomonas sp. PDM19]|uniref:HNH endonuclease n=1 Tax=Pseudomonas sp. PDM19 TaxID=2769272 RepID=UPI001784D452|nr:HNH endonuclease [Pseudomonas sp. PDM19]MBD9632890.1 HNH endonuclease [Pseudomonas sp. PDM19]
MDSFVPPKPGATLNNEELTRWFKCSPQGGMRRSKETNTLVIVSNHVKSVYDDRWSSDVLHYTGMGQKGNQSLTFAQNKTLHKSSSNGVAVHLFEVFTPKVYTYIGEVELSGSAYSEKQFDVLGSSRLVWIFPLRLKTGVPPEIPEATLYELRVLKEKQIRRLSDEQVAEQARRTGRKRVGQRSVHATQHQRSLWVAEHAKRRAKGRCELCEGLAPFTRKDGTAYLETHHIVWLARDGEDTVENTVALCPNCHRRMHVLNDKADVKTLKRRLLVERSKA